MPADGTQLARRESLSVRTLLDTGHRYDAGRAGYDMATPPEEGGLRIMFDGRHSIPSVVLTGQDGEIELCGLSMIDAALDALMDARKMAVRMGGF